MGTEYGNQDLNVMGIGVLFHMAKQRNGTCDVNNGLHWGVGIRGTDTEVYRYGYKGGGLDMRTKEGLSVSVLYG